MVKWWVAASRALHRHRKARAEQVKAGASLTSAPRDMCSVATAAFALVRRQAAYCKEMRFQAEMREQSLNFCAHPVSLQGTLHARPSRPPDSRPRRLLGMVAQQWQALTRHIRMGRRVVDLASFMLSRAPLIGVLAACSESREGHGKCQMSALLQTNHIMASRPHAHPGWTGHTANPLTAYVRAIT